jgi:hypothetical protein
MGIWRRSIGGKSNASARPGYKDLIFWHNRRNLRMQTGGNSRVTRMLHIEQQTRISSNTVEYQEVPGIAE